MLQTTDGLLQRTVARARGRLLPFLLLMYIVSVLDRANIGFAKQALQSSRGISEAAYALGAGLFFLTYAIFEIPSNLLMRRVGAKLWLSRIMVSWGLISTATMFVTGDASFYCLRLLLGAAEAGFFPGVILYLTDWFPRETRGRMLGLFYFGAPLSFILGSPLSGFLMGMKPALGLRGWQWMFLVEGMLAVAVGICAFFVLDDGPASAKWLSEAEKQSLAELLGAEEDARQTHGPSSAAALLKDPRIPLFALTYLLIQAGVYGVIFYLPTEIEAILGTRIGLKVGLVSAVPWLVSIASTWWLSRAADRCGSRRLLASLGLAAAASAILAIPFGPPAMAMASLCVAASGYIAVQPLFWTFPTSYFPAANAAAGIALINSCGNLGGFLAPNLKVWAEAYFHSATAGAIALALLTCLAAVLMAFLPDPQMRSRPGLAPARSSVRK